MCESGNLRFTDMNLVVSDTWDNYSVEKVSLPAAQVILR